MTAAEKPQKNEQRGDRAVELRVAARLENLAVLRTLVGAVGTFEDLDFDRRLPTPVGTTEAVALYLKAVGIQTVTIPLDP